jgi:hypothetical protein
LLLAICHPQFGYYPLFLIWQLLFWFSKQVVPNTKLRRCCSMTQWALRKVTVLALAVRASILLQLQNQAHYRILVPQNYKLMPKQEWLVYSRLTVQRLALTLLLFLQYCWTIQQLPRPVLSLPLQSSHVRLYHLVLLIWVLDSTNHTTLVPKKRGRYLVALLL